MATDSIFHMVHITDPKEAERFVEVLEAAERWAMEHQNDVIDVPPCQEMTDEDIKRIFGDN